MLRLTRALGLLSLFVTALYWAAAGNWSTPADVAASGPIGPVAVCFAPGTPDEYIERVLVNWNWLSEERFNIGGRWNIGVLGDPISLTWSFVPDGVTIPGGSVQGELTSPSNLFTILDSQFAGQGGRATWVARFQACFDRWQQVTGVNYTRVTVPGEDWDDGQVWGAGGGPQRGDVRIAMHLIDGTSNVLAYNQFPSSGGDMVLDSAENWATAANENRFLRNVVMHEHGHGLGLAHVCPVIGQRLMEPFINTSFDGPQHDDIRGADFNYGDRIENNDTPATATALGNLANGVPVNLGDIPPPALANSSTIAINLQSDVDYYSFSTTFSANLNVTITPVGISNYDSSPQSCTGQTASCCSGNFVDSLAAADLNFQIIAFDGTTVVHDQFGQPAGSPESVTNLPLVGSPGNFYLRVHTPTNFSGSQLYKVSITANLSGSDLTPPIPNPSSFSINPHPISTSAIHMQATESVDGASPPVQYFFDFTSGTGFPTGSDSGWISSRDYTNSGLAANHVYRYRVRARDSAPLPNQTIFSAEFPGSTAIETPTGISFGAITNTSIVVNATGSFTNLFFGDTGFFFEMFPAGGSGANLWVSNPTTTVTGLDPCKVYTFRVKARNVAQVETPYTGYASTSTTGTCECTLLGDVNQDTVLDARDIPGFIRSKLGQAIGGDYPPCADFNQGSVEADTDAFAAALLGQ